MDLGSLMKTGGWGMYPTFAFGVLLICTGTIYAIRPRRLVPLMLAVGLTTVSSGILGFITGVIKSFMSIGNVGPDQRYLAMTGVAESAHNLALAFVFVTLVAVLAAVGAARIARILPPEVVGEAG